MPSRLFSRPPLQQPNIKQKFVALLKRFKVTDEVRPVFPRVFLTCGAQKPEGGM